MSKKKKSQKKVETNEESTIIGSEEDALNTNVQDIMVIEPDVKPTDDDEITVFRDVFTMTDDERNSDDNANINSIRLSPPPKPSWSDDPKNVLYPTGTLVMKKGKYSLVYRVSSPSREKDFYHITASKSANTETAHADQLKLAPKNAEWVKYWDTIPVIKAPVLKKEVTGDVMKNTSTKDKKKVKKKNKK